VAAAALILLGVIVLPVIVVGGVLFSDTMDEIAKTYRAEQDEVYFSICWAAISEVARNAE
jgi:hypothetical protein